MKTLSLSLAAALLATTALAEARTRTITFTHEGATLTGTLHLPADHDGAPVPAVVVTGAWTSVQGQMPRVYAEALAERGVAAFTFDFRGWGASGDLPGGRRFREDPAAKTADIAAAFAALAAQPEVDPARLGGLGICASAGHMIDAAAADPRIARVGLVAPWLQNAAIVEAVYGGHEGVAALTALSRAAEAEGGRIIPAAGPVGAEGVLMPIGGYYADPARGAIPDYDNRWDQASWEGWLAYHPADDGARLAKPLAVVHSEAAAIPQGLRAFLDGYGDGAAVRWLDGVAQFDFYDDPQAVAAAADAMAAHFAARP